jgi:hypothetical protein
MTVMRLARLLGALGHFRILVKSGGWKRSASVRKFPHPRMPAVRSELFLAIAPSSDVQRAPRPNSTTSTVWMRISRSNSRLWFFT